MKKTPGKKKTPSSKMKYKVVELPSDNATMEKFVEKNRIELNRRIVDNIEYAVQNKLGGVEMFCFKNSNFVVVINRKDFKENLQNIFDYSVNNNQFELCERAKRLISRIDRISYVHKYNKIK